MRACCIDYDTKSDMDGAGEDRNGLERSGSGTCSDCGSISYSRQWEHTFGVKLCNDCRGNYTLISKVRFCIHVRPMTPSKRFTCAFTT